MEKSLNIADIIVTFITGKATWEQITILDEWMNESEENKRLFLSLMDESAFEKHIHEIVNTDIAFQRVVTRRHMLHKRKQQRIMAMVASIAMILSFTGLWLLGTTEEKEMIARQEYISTGKSKAFLTLASGKKLLLEKQDTLLQGDHANIRVLEKGEVSYETIDNTTSQEIEYNTMETPRGAEFQLVLADGTKVWLNAETKLRYPVHFSQAERRVELTGEAYFDVQHNETPFIVKTSRSDVIVMGTEVCIRDYTGETNRTTLVRGKVAVKNRSGETYLIRPGQQVCIDKDEGKVADVETIYFTSWKDGYFIFNEATLGEIMKELSKWYDFDYGFADTGTTEIRLTARLKKYDDINLILDILSRTGAIGFSQRERFITIENKKEQKTTGNRLHPNSP
ncbi:MULTISPECIES: FecR family protein [Sanguibacteroides]|uniref:Uncharacterized protein n=1 Tax=Sanguibacteroides justesenii TaxID=1547597 RepID=A0A0C3ME36_9PORP|nr:MULTISPECIES: FecR domain-containing protein [Sanguibacteroides]KIO44703.1 hypothetical protein BA92_06605 [Sanguibacteroides justesenii]PXZ43331.1 DUF4974 domain-containing protein [Sanguibacteroides justesenii]